MEDALKNLQNKYDALFKENKNNIDKISALQKEVKSLKMNPPFLKCEECEYPAEDLFDLGEHVYVTHKFEDSDEYNYCDHCGEKCETKNSLMKHRKNKHKEKVNMCR